MYKINACDLAWLAGFIDGDGTITMAMNHRHGPYPLVAARNCDRPTLEHIVFLMGGTIHANYRQAPQRDAYQWMLWGQKALHVLRLVEPFLVQKRRQAQIILMAYNAWKPRNRYDEGGKQRVRQLAETVQGLNRRGR